MKKEDSTIKLSIIIPYYKTYDLTCTLLDNLCNQLTKETEIILIDESNEERLNNYNVKLYHYENKGLSHARNRGLDKAIGKYVTFIDSDDNISDKYVKTIIDKINKEDFDYCMFSWQFTGTRNDIVKITEEAPDWNHSVWNCVYKKTLLGQFEEGIHKHEDGIFNFKYRHGKRANIEEILYYYNYQRKDSLSDRYFSGKIKIQEPWFEGQTLLSIIIPYYKTYELTCKMLDVLCKQINNKVEVLLIDDGCNDNFDKYPIEIIRQENGGVSKARNKGLDNAIGQYITFIDSDDMIKDNYIDKIINKIENSEFDYCFFSWEATGRIKGQFIIKDNPPSWNTSVWNCIYKRELIGIVRFNESKTIEEDTEFNLAVRKGKKENIEDILYVYNSGREGSITSTYRENNISTKENKNEINTQVIVYRSFLSKIGGIETAIYNFCLSLKDKYDIVFIYDTVAEGNLAQLRRLKKIVRCENYKGQTLNCDTFIYYGINPQNIENTLNARKDVIQQICNDFTAYPIGFIPSPKTTKFYADSEASAISFTKKYKKECGVLHNLFVIKPKKALLLCSASRLAPEKGYGRMKIMAKRMHDKEIPFIWTVFTNDLPNEEIDGFIFMKPRLNVIDYMTKMDYVLQLSDFESWGCTITESLEVGTPVISTDFASAKEQVEDGVNGFILQKSLRNLDEVIDKMYSSNLKGFKYTPKYSIKEWTDAIGDLGKPKLDYKYSNDEVIGYEVQVLKDCYYSVEQRQCLKGDTLIIGTESRLEYLEKLGYVKRIGELI